METLNLLAAGPELVLIGGAIALLMLGVFTKGEEAASLILWLAVGVLCAAGLVAYASPAANEMAFGGVFISDGMSRFAKLFMIFGSAVVLILSRDYMKRANILLFEFPVLVLMAVAGMCMMVSSADLISLYVGLELQSLSLYVLASFRRDSVRSTEAGLKYFVLGALSSGLLLFGSSFVYGYAGSTEFVQIASRLEDGADHRVLCHGAKGCGGGSAGPRSLRCLWRSVRAVVADHLVPVRRVDDAGRDRGHWPD